MSVKTGTNICLVTNDFRGKTNDESAIMSDPFQFTLLKQCGFACTKAVS